jgi:Holliday junction resolvase-like predicted endonuclease
VLAEHDGKLVLVEVKSTERAGAEPPFGRLGGPQRARLEAIGRWLTLQRAFAGRGFRLDVVAVTLDQGAPVVTIRPDAL